MFPVFLHPELPSGTLRPTTAVATALIPIEMEWQATLFSFTGVTPPLAQGVEHLPAPSRHFQCKDLYSYH